MKCCLTTTSDRFSTLAYHAGLTLQESAVCIGYWHKVTVTPANMQFFFNTTVDLAALGINSLQEKEVKGEVPKMF